LSFDFFTGVSRTEVGQSDSHQVSASSYVSYGWWSGSNAEQQTATRWTRICYHYYWTFW